MSDTIVNVHKASLSTVSVEIKAIRISNKQMTISVFKQLKCAPPVSRNDGEENIVDMDNVVTLSGIPWGVVNFTYANSPEWSDYYLIWQRDNELLKSPMCFIENLHLNAGPDTYGERFFAYLFPGEFSGQQIWDSGNNDYLTGSEYEDTEEVREGIAKYYYNPLLKILSELEAMDQLFISV